ncbi:MAG: hypothetical protein M0R06_22645 [Sphaerochaeta sp.]|nr:hypothetical protein [Sphaerochaeta sp.]
MVAEDTGTGGVSLSPGSMVDSAADWPLHRIVEHLRQKEKGDRPVTVSIHCRSSIKAFVTMIDEVAERYGVSRNRMSCWLAYHGLMFAREDATIARLAALQAKIRKEALMKDDTDTIDMMNSLIPYSPHYQETVNTQLFLYDWVSSEFEDLSRICGVRKPYIVQIYQSRSVLTDDVSNLVGTASRLEREVSRWDTWMGLRLDTLERLVKE